MSELRGIFWLVLAVLGFHTFIAKPFYIPSESMLPGLLVGLTLHEMAHAWSAWRLGDGFARRQGRVSINPLRHLSLLGTLALFVIPVDRQRRVFAMDWATARKVPWEILILFGGGLSLAAAVSETGLAHFLGTSLVPLGAWGIAAIVVGAVVLVIFLTELTSNLATTATLLPVLAALALELGISPVTLTVPVALAASCAFMLPVATPPNAIVFGSGMITIPQMAKAGFVMNLLGIVLLSLVALLLAPQVLG